ncbi:N-terminal acetyltransferase [Pestalotiopsis sp. 9143b]|nr:N-terminal acetyltransferase [Pestalotiopsis sp. 9143b]
MSTLPVPPAPPSSPLTPAQISQFLSHIALPRHLHTAPPTLSLLRALHTHMLAACPYENLSIHYSPAHAVSLDPQTTFRKIVDRAAGRGGYCMELAILYNHVLRGLGFAAYTVGARTRPRVDGVPGGDFPGWVHIVNVVTLDGGARYAVDVAFGGDGPTAPMPLVDGAVQGNLGAQEVRLVRDWASTQVHRVDEAKLWIYQYRNGQDKEWNSYYAFTETEFMAADWGVVNYWTSTCPDSHQTRTVLVVRFLARQKPGGEEGELEIYGKRMLVNGVVKENLGGKTRQLASCKTEAERIDVLRSQFNITLSQEEADSIKNWVTDLELTV